MPWLLVIAGAAALLMLATRRGGWTKANGGIVISPSSAAWLDRLRAKVPSSIPLVVTSGTRTATSQARAMLTMVNLGDAGVKQAFFDYPDDLVNDLLELPRTLEAWTPRVTQAYANGELSSSGHLAGLAVDLRRRDWTPEQLATVVAAVKALGGEPLVENAPPHLHIQLPKPKASSSTPKASSSSSAEQTVYVPELDAVSFEDDDGWSEP